MRNNGKYNKGNRGGIIRGILLIISLIILFPAFVGCTDEDETYLQAYAAFENGEYSNALSLLESIPEHNDTRNIRTQAEQGLLRLEAVVATRNGNYQSAIRLLDYLPDFPEANSLRNEAEHGIFRENIIRDINEAFTLGNYEAVLDILDSNPQFYDDMGLRDEALTAIMTREAEQETEQEDNIEMLSVMISEMFEIATLEIESRNMTRTEVVPGGFANPGTITLILEFDSRVVLGVANPQYIEMRVDDNIVYIRESSVQIEVLESIVRNFEQVERIRSNPLVSFTQAVTNQIFEAQNALEAEMAENLVTERTIESARRSFMNSLTGFIQGLGFSVVWE